MEKVEHPFAPKGEDVKHPELWMTPAQAAIISKHRAKMASIMEPTFSNLGEGKVLTTWGPKQVVPLLGMFGMKGDPVPEELAYTYRCKCTPVPGDHFCRYSFEKMLIPEDLREDMRQLWRELTFRPPAFKDAQQAVLSAWDAIGKFLSSEFGIREEFLRETDHIIREFSRECAYTPKEHLAAERWEREQKVLKLVELRNVHRHALYARNRVVERINARLIAQAEIGILRSWEAHQQSLEHKSATDVDGDAVMSAASAAGAASAPNAPAAAIPRRDKRPLTGAVHDEVAADGSARLSKRQRTDVSSSASSSSAPS